MDLDKSGKLLSDLRKAKKMTQKQVAQILGVLPKTVSKWETKKGFPDVSLISALADIYGVSERLLLSGTKPQNPTDTGNLKRTKFYVCPECQSITEGVGKCQTFCCGNLLEPLKSSIPDTDHSVKLSEIENDIYIEFDHEMTKDHFISFAAYVGFDRVLLIRLYPEQDSSVRFPKMRGGKLYFYCTKHGLFEYK